MTLWTIQSMEFSRSEYWSGLPFSSPGDLPNREIKPRSAALQVDSLPAEPQGKPYNMYMVAYPQVLVRGRQAKQRELTNSRE